MASDRKFYRTVITYEIMSEEPIGEPDLETINYETSEGHWSGHFTDRKTEELTGPQAAAALANQGSDPEFFCLTADGEDTADAI